MAYLRYYDYMRTIQADNLSQIIGSDTGVRLTSEVAAQAEAISYLVQKYDVTSEFTDTTVFSKSATYKAGALVELNYSEYDSAKSYITNDLTTYSGSCYICTGATTGTFSPSKWFFLGVKFDLFHVTLPAVEFDYKKYYKVGDQVFFKDKTYTALLATPIIDHSTALQYGQTTAVPLPNIFPDDPLEGSRYWGTGTPYSITGVLPTDTTKWAAGDNRSVQLVQKVIDICLYHIHSRIAPRNIPQLRIDRYASAIAWLDMAKTGEVTADIPLLQPKKDGRIRWGSNIRNTNNY